MNRRTLQSLSISVVVVILIVVPTQISALVPDPAVPGKDQDRLALSAGPERREYHIVKPLAVRSNAGTKAEPLATTMTENFEGAWPAEGWSLVDQSAEDGGEFLVGKRNCHPHSGSNAGWTVGGGAQGNALSCSANYPNNVDTWAVYGPFDLTQATSASLTYYLWGQAEAATDYCYDFLVIADSINGSNYDHGYGYCGDWTSGDAGNSYYRRTLDLSNRLGQPQVWIAVAFISDGSITYTGMMVDDLTLDVASEAASQRYVHLPLLLRQPTPTSPPVPAAPELDPITPPEGNPQYTIRWSAAARAETYLLERATNPAFTDAVTLYTGPATQYTATSQGIATYHYRVKARNPWGDSPWSNTQAVEVRWEQEPNNAYTEANGPLTSGKRYYGYPETINDYYYFVTNSAGEIRVEIANHSAQGGQLVLWYQSTDLPGNRKGNCAATPGCTLTYNGPAGRYYVQVYTADGHNMAAPYTLQVTHP